MPEISKNANLGKDLDIALFFQYHVHFHFFYYMYKNIFEQDLRT